MLKYCAISESRKKLMVARETAYGNNLELMDKGAKLRKQIAQILGYARRRRLDSAQARGASVIDPSLAPGRQATDISAAGLQQPTIMPGSMGK